MNQVGTEDYNSVVRYDRRSDDYDRYRPSYPGEAVDFLIDSNLQRPVEIVADIGSGTGLFSESLIARGFTVLAVEPSGPMANAAKRRLGGSPLFRSIRASAEQTGIASKSVDAITCAQSFHWFTAEAAADEFCRILRPGGTMLMLWNELSVTHNRFHHDYADALRRSCPDIQSFGINDIRYSTSYFERLFAGSSVNQKRILNPQTVTYEQLVGRTASLSYSPPSDGDAFADLACRLDELFHAHQRDGLVRLHYELDLYRIMFE